MTTLRQSGTWDDGLQAYSDGAKWVYNPNVGAGDRRSLDAFESYSTDFREWVLQLVTATAAAAIGADGMPVLIGFIRVAGTANLGGAATIAKGTLAANVVQETIPSAAVPGTERDYKGGAKFDTGCVVTVATSGDVIVAYKQM